MKRITALILIMLLLCGCSVKSGNDNTESHPQITINLPTDNTVNGYRENKSVSEMPQTISTDEVKPASPEQNASAADSETEYIGNSNSHVFHKSDCGSAGTMKEENKVLFKNRDDAVKSGYKPCKRCNP